MFLETRDLATIPFLGYYDSTLLVWSLREPHSRLSRGDACLSRGSTVSASPVRFLGEEGFASFRLHEATGVCRSRVKRDPGGPLESRQNPFLSEADGHDVVHHRY